MPIVSRATPGGRWEARPRLDGGFSPLARVTAPAYCARSFIASSSLTLTNIVGVVEYRREMCRVALFPRRVSPSEPNPVQIGSRTND